MSGPSRKSKRTGKVTIRITPEQRALIDQAAEAQRKSRSASTPDAAPPAAEVVPLEQTLLQVDARTHERLAAMLEAPPPLNDKLRKLMQSKARRE